MGSLLIFLIRKLKDMGLCFNLATSYSQLVRIYTYDPFKTVEHTLPMLQFEEFSLQCLDVVKEVVPPNQFLQIFIDIYLFFGTATVDSQASHTCIERAGLLSTGA